MDRKFEQRICINFCYKIEKSASETLDLLKLAFGNENVNKPTTFRWFSRFKNGMESVKDEKRVGRTILHRNPEKVSQISNLIKENPRIGLRDIEEETGISKSFVGSIIKEDLQLKKTPSKFVPKILTIQQKENRVEVAKKCLKWWKKTLIGRKNIATGPLLRRLELTLGVGNVIAYADDIVLLFHRDGDFERVATVFEEYKQASGVGVNLRKSAGLWCGAWRNRGDSPLGASWSTTSIRVLGLDIAPRSTVAHREQHLLALLETACRKWTPFTRGLSLVGRARAANTLVGSVIQHHLHGYLPSPPTIAKLQARLARFVWGQDHTAWLPADVMARPVAIGGLGLLDLATQLQLACLKGQQRGSLDPPSTGRHPSPAPPSPVAEAMGGGLQHPGPQPPGGPHGSAAGPPHHRRLPVPPPSRPPGPRRWSGARVRDLIEEEHLIARPTRSALTDAAALGAFCRRLTSENAVGFGAESAPSSSSLAAAVVLRGTATPFLNGLTTRSARRALDRPRLAATSISRFLARWTPTINPPSRIDWASLRRCAYSGHEADAALKLALHALPHPAHPASAWIFGGSGLEDDALSILASAKLRIYRYFVQVGLGEAVEDPLIAWSRTLQRRGLLPLSPFSGNTPSLARAESPSKAEEKPARLGSKAQPSAELPARNALKFNSSMKSTKNQRYANPATGGKDANPAAPTDFAAASSSEAAAQAHRNWAELTEDSNSEYEGNFTIVQKRKRRRGSANSMGAARQEVRTTRAHIVEARARQASSTEDHCVYVERSPELEPYHYMRAMDRMFGSTREVFQVTKMNGHFLVGLANKSMAERLVNEGLEVEGTLHRVFPFRKRAERITVGNLPFFVGDAAVISALTPLGRVTSIAPKLMKAGPYTYNDGRREAFIILREGMTIEGLPTRLNITIKGEAWPAYLSSGIRCSRCRGQGHRRANCPLLAGRTNAPGPATPTSPTSVPSASAPGLPQQPSAQPPPPASPSPAMEVSEVPSTSRAALPPAAPRQSPPVAPAIPTEMAPPAPPPVAPAPSLRAPGSHGPAVPTLDVEMSIEETSTFRAALKTSPAAVPPTPPLPAPQPAGPIPPAPDEEEMTPIMREECMVIEIFKKLKHLTCLRPLYQSGIQPDDLKDAILFIDERESLMARLTPAMKGVLAEFLSAAIEPARANIRC
ncbi:hypothetical protein LAZ67_12000522 [Cordylochernes scorpioides]|uniref:Mos1 transposase HTH domain-containing protein n=1 Tax=Cordylochernes scorpioides TaxID=51811 RepID=A0ABY6L0M5_9ARAC|nr:hypothetical protein LAZ67_12000522 [Cordylochernes scorpioides]